MSSAFLEKKYVAKHSRRPNVTRRNPVKELAKIEKLKHGQVAASTGSSASRILIPGTVLATNPSKTRNQNSTTFTRALKAIGHNELLELVRLVVSEEMDARAARPSKPNTARREQTIVGRDTQLSLSAQAMAEALNVRSDETVRQREAAGELFSILAPGRKRGRTYPAFQSWTGIVGEPLKKVLLALKPKDGTVAYTFFTSITDLLAALTPIECILGALTSERSITPAANELLQRNAEQRVDLVIKAAKTYAAIDRA